MQECDGADGVTKLTVNETHALAAELLADPQAAEPPSAEMPLRALPLAFVTKGDGDAAHGPPRATETRKTA